jgi:tetratricopeptide (TPR) repeat protein
VDGQEDSGVGSGPARGNSITGGTFYGPVIQAGSTGAVALADRPPRPFQVPSRQRGFVNRENQLAVLRELMADRGAGSDPLAPSTPRLAVISGLGGVGKTQLISQWAWGTCAAFPDGQLYVDLANHRHDGAVDTGSVLHAFLRSLGVPESEMGVSSAERAATFRTHTASTRLLVVIDNAQHAAEVRPLLPASGLLVVLSRRRLPSLRMDGAEELALGPLDSDAGTRLFSTWLDAGRASPAELNELVELCDGLPLALRAVGNILLDRPGLSVRALLAELADERRRIELMADDPQALGGSADAGIVAVLDASYDAAPEHTRQALRLLGVFPGTTFVPDLLAEGGADAGRAAAAVDDLLARYLAGEVRMQDGTLRYRLHDLVRAHARLRAGRELPEDERLLTLRAFVDFYRRWAAQADLAVLGDRFRLSPLSGPSAFGSSAAALDWLEAERSNLLAVLDAAAAEGWHDEVWQLCESLWALYHSRKLMSDWELSHRTGIESAQWTGRIDAQVRLRNQLARCHLESGDPEGADAELARAAELLGLVSAPQLPGMIWETQGLVWLERSQPRRAAELFAQARDANAAAEDQHGVVVQSYNVAQALLQDGRPGEAERTLREALALAVSISDDAMRPRIGIVRGKALRALGDEAEAVRHTLDAGDWAATLGLRAKLVQALAELSELAAGTRDAELAARCRREASALRERGGLPEEDGDEGAEA